MNNKKTEIGYWLKAFGPGATLTTDTYWCRETTLGGSYASYRMEVAVVDGTGRIVATAYLGEVACGRTLPYEEEDWTDDSPTVKEAKEEIARLAQLDVSGTNIELFDGVNGVLPWENVRKPQARETLLGGLVSLAKRLHW